MKRLIVLLTALAMLGLVAGPASAQVPPGEGLAAIQCDEFGTVMIPRGGGGPGWVADDGSMWLLLSVTSVGPEGEFNLTKGNKTGLLDETATCSFSEGPFSETITVVRVR